MILIVQKQVFNRFCFFKTTALLCLSNYYYLRKLCFIFLISVLIIDLQI